MLVTNGGKQAIYDAFAAMLDPGDEVIVPAPYWTTYPEAIQLAGGVAVEVLADETQDYKVTVEQLEAARTDRTKVLLFVSPSNPTGAVYTAEEIEAIGRWVEDHGLWVLTDEIYEHLVYDGVETGSLPVLCPYLADNCVVVNGVAKTYAMTGWRVGWMIGPADLVKAATNLQSHATSNVSNVAQRAALAAVSGDLTAVEEMKVAFDRRRKTIVAMLNEIDGVVCPTPQGAFYAYPSVKGLLGKEHGGRAIERPPSWPSSSSTRPRSRWCPARRSAPRATCGSRTRSATTTSSRASPGCRSSSPEPVATRGSTGVGSRDLHALPKAHLHLHFTGSMRHETLLELAERDGIVLPDALVSDWPPKLSAADEKGWFRFQRLYDVARSVLRTEDDVRRLVREAAEDDVRDGGRWLEIQVDPSGYAARFGGDHGVHRPGPRRGGDASASTGLGMAVVIAANRTRHPLDARTLARLAVQYADRGVVGFGLSNDERRGQHGRLRRRRSRSRERAGLLLVPHGGELRGPEHVRDCLDDLRRGAARPRRAVRGGPAPAGPGRRRRGCPGGLPGLQRGARRLLRPDLGAAAPADRRRRHRGAGRRRPAALRLAAGRAVRHDARRPRPHRRPARRAGPDVGAGSAPRTTSRRRAGRHRRLAGGPRAWRIVRSAAQRSTPTVTGSLTSVTPNASCTPSRTSRASASRSSVVASPRLVRARVCLVES